MHFFASLSGYKVFFESSNIVSYNKKMKRDINTPLFAENKLEDRGQSSKVKVLLPGVGKGIIGYGSKLVHYR